MAAIAASQVTVLFDYNAGQRVVGYLLKNVDTTDTYNPSDRFALVESATFFVSGGTTTVGTVAAATSDFTTLTLTLAGTTNASAWLLVKGQSST